MKPTTAEWVAKAEGDFAMVGRERRARKAPNHDGACFHAQQCAEKYLKACLEEASVPIARTHDLLVLLADVLPVAPTFAPLRPDLAGLTDYAVRYRYPGDTASNADAANAAAMSRRVRMVARLHLGLQ